MVLSRPSTSHFLFCKYFTIQSDSILPILHRNNKLNGATHKKIPWNLKKPTLLFKFTMCQREGRTIKSQALGARPQGSGPLQMSPQKAGRQLLGAEQTLLFVPLYIGWKSAFDFWAAPRACCCWAPTGAGGSRRAMEEQRALF